MRLFTILSFALLSSFMYGQTSHFFDDIQSAIETLEENEFVTIEYNKSGDWGAYEGGKLILELQQDTIKMNLNTRQNYLGAKNKITSASYEKLELLATLEENKRTYYKDPDQIVFNNRFNYRILKDEVVLSSGSSPLEPSDVVNPIKLNHKLGKVFFKDQSKIFKNNIKG